MRSPTGPRDSRTSGLELVLAAYLEEKGYLRQGREALASLLWAEVVGPWYARHTEVLRIESGVVSVRCASAPHAQQLQADSAQILERLNRRLSRHLVPEAGEAPETAEGPPRFLTEIRAGSAYQGKRRGRRPAATPGSDAPAPAPGEIEAMPLTAEEETRVQELAADIAEDGLRRRFAATLRRQLRLQRWERAHGWRPCETCERLLPPGERCLACRPLEPPPQVRH